MDTMILIPSTFTADEKNLMLRIYKIGTIARVISTFAIRQIGVYYDRDPNFDSHALGRFIVKVLKYINTPPYLRRYAFPIDSDLRYIGVIEPLKTRHHLKSNGRYRYVQVLEDKGDYVVCSDGRATYKLKKTKAYMKGLKIYLADLSKKIIVSKTAPKEYYGYEVFYFSKPLKYLLKKLKSRGYYIIGTSRYGEDIRLTRFEKNSKIAIVFGGPYRGLKDILSERDTQLMDVLVNFVPGQEVETIRMEEAVHYVLSILRYRGLI